MRIVFSVVGSAGTHTLTNTLLEAVHSPLSQSTVGHGSSEEGYHVNNFDPILLWKKLERVSHAHEFSTRGAHVARSRFCALVARHCPLVFSFSTVVSRISVASGHLAHHHWLK